MQPMIGSAHQFKMLGEMVSANDPIAQGPLRHEVVDGQQRLVTLALTLRASAYLVRQEELKRKAMIVNADSHPELKRDEVKEDQAETTKFDDCIRPTGMETILWRSSHHSTQSCGRGSVARFYKTIIQR